MIRRSELRVAPRRRTQWHVIASRSRPPKKARASRSTVGSLGSSRWSFIVVAYYVIFRLPFRFPPTRKISSASVVLGFNNSVAIGGMVFLIAAATLFLLWRRGEARGTLAETSWFRVEQTPSAERIRPGAFALMVLAHALLTLAMWVKAQTSAPRLIDFEASHFLWRLQSDGAFRRPALPGFSA